MFLWINVSLKDKVIFFVVGVQLDPNSNQLSKKFLYPIEGIEEYLKCDYACQSSMILWRASDPSTKISFSSNDFVIVRNHILFKLCYVNGLRSGVVCGLTLNNYKTGISQYFAQSAKCATFFVLKYKVSAQGLLEVSSKDIDDFINYDTVRQYVLPKSSAFFPSVYGSSLTSSSLAKGLAYTFQQSGLKCRVSKIMKKIITCVHLTSQSDLKRYLIH